MSDHATEASPLLQKNVNNSNNNNAIIDIKSSPLASAEEGSSTAAATAASSLFPITILGELIGARHLVVASSSNNNNHRGGRIAQPYCSVQYGSQTIHRTRPYKSSNNNNSDPIWSLHESSLFLLKVSQKDVRNNKTLTVTVWGRSGKVLTSSSVFLGKIRIKTSDLLENYIYRQSKEKPLERIELELVNELGESMLSSSSSANPHHSSRPKLALRFRMATAADVKFVQAWKTATSAMQKTLRNHQRHTHTLISSNIFKGTGVLPAEHRPRAALVTELPERDVPAAAWKNTLSSSVAARAEHVVRIKPGPDLSTQQQQQPSQPLYMTSAQLKRTTQQPSRNWIEVGTNGSDGNIGRLYLEILSCHNLPNVDYGNAVGNNTDAFCCVVYGDAAVQTDVINDELSPHWMPWTQRAFVLNMLHPSSILYIAAFGYKRGALFPHVPIGRVEINPIHYFSSTSGGVEYNLQYALSQSSHVTTRKSVGTIRIRLRVELLDERKTLLAAAWKPPPTCYVNVKKKKSLAVVRYTAAGEYDNEEKFTLRVLLAYIDEIKDGFLRRMLYSAGDAAQSVVFWRGQVKCRGCAVWFPIHSLLLFGAGIVIVENPQLLPASLFLGMAYLMLVNMQLRRQSPSPWHRCFPFGHYFRILLFGKSSGTEFNTIKRWEGWKDQSAIEEALRKRMADDDRFFQKKEAVEKQIEAVEKVSVETKSRAAVIPVELLVIMGKLQGIVGGVVRLCRSIDVVLTWEECDLAFWVTAAFLIVGIVFLFIPWAFLLKWTSRCAVVLLLGPQNKLIDIFLIMKNSDERKLRQIFRERIFRARCRQEEASKLKAFRHVLYGKYSAVIPSIKWTPHLDRPLPQSYALTTTSPLPPISDHCPLLPGQKLYGPMVPRPYDQWLHNEQESKIIKERVKTAISELERCDPLLLRASSSVDSDVDQPTEEGFEVSDLYDVEAGSAPTVSGRRATEVKGDWGVEVVDLYEDEAKFVRKSWRGSMDDLHVGKILSLSESDSESGEEEAKNSSLDAMDGKDTEGLAQNAHPSAQAPLFEEEMEDHVIITNAEGGSSQQELGVEVVEHFEQDDALAEQSRHSVSQMDESLYSSLENIESGLNDGVAWQPDANVQTLQAERSASQRELGFEILENDKNKPE